MHTKVCLNVRHRVVSPARIAERTASPEIRLKLYHTSGLRGSHQHLIAEAPEGRPLEELEPTPTLVGNGARRHRTALEEGGGLPVLRTKSIRR